MSIASKRSGMMREIGEPTFAELYAPKLIRCCAKATVWGFSCRRISGLTVAIVALPLVDGDRHRVRA